MFGYGLSDADMVLVGEQPGDREGKPYATNVVKSPLTPHVLATVHPSSILRAHDQQRQVALQGLINDLAVAATVLP